MFTTVELHLGHAPVRTDAHRSCSSPHPGSTSKLENRHFLRRACMYTYTYIYIYLHTHTHIYICNYMHTWKTLPSKNTGNLRKIIGPCPKKCLKQMEVSGKIMENPWTFYGNFQEQTVSLPEGSASTTWKSCIWGVNQQNHGKTTWKP